MGTTTTTAQGNRVAKLKLVYDIYGEEAISRLITLADTLVLNGGDGIEALMERYTLTEAEDMSQLVIYDVLRDDVSNAIPNNLPDDVAETMEYFIHDNPNVILPKISQGILFFMKTNQDCNIVEVTYPSSEIMEPTAPHHILSGVVNHILNVDFDPIDDMIKVIDQNIAMVTLQLVNPFYKDSQEDENE